MKLKELFDIKTMEEFAALRDSLNLTDRQIEIFNMRFNKGCSIIELSMKLNLSTATINRELKKISNKISKL